MNDLISRQAAITAIQNAYCDTEGGEDKYAVWKNAGLTEALHIMQDLPSAQPEKTGKWIETVKHYKDDEQEYDYIEVNCSECGVRRKIGWRDANYCPMCGAKMEES